MSDNGFFTSSSTFPTNFITPPDTHQTSQVKQLRLPTKNIVSSVCLTSSLNNWSVLNTFFRQISLPSPVSQSSTLISNSSLFSFIPHCKNRQTKKIFYSIFKPPTPEYYVKKDLHLKKIHFFKVQNSKTKRPTEKKEQTFWNLRILSIFFVCFVYERSGKERRISHVRGRREKKTFYKKRKA